MRIALTDLERLSGAYNFLRAIFEQLAASISLWADKEHLQDGKHADVTATSLDVSGQALHQGTQLDGTILWGHLLGLIEPAQLTANQNNYNPPGLQTSWMIKLQLDAARSITGIAVPSPLTLDGRQHFRRLQIVNTSAFNLTLVHASGSSTDINRFLCPNAADMVVRPNGTVWIHYDSGADRWYAEGI